jgi:hypothetical protein
MALPVRVQALLLRAESVPAQLLCCTRMIESVPAQLLCCTRMIRSATIKTFSDTSMITLITADATSTRHRHLTTTTTTTTAPAAAAAQTLAAFAWQRAQSIINSAILITKQEHLCFWHLCLNVHAGCIVARSLRQFNVLRE